LPAASFLSATAAGREAFAGKRLGAQEIARARGEGRSGKDNEREKTRADLSGRELGRERLREELRRLRRGARRFVADAPERLSGGIRQGRVRRE
jgi:hypothetical protein